MTRKTIDFKLADSAFSAAARFPSAPGTRDSWVAGDGAHASAVAGDGAHASVPRGSAGAAATAPTASRPGAQLFWPGMVAARCLTAARGAEEIGRVWTQAAAHTAQRSSETAYRMMACWTPLQAASFHHDLASESLRDAFTLAARTASIAERVSREAAGLSGRLLPPRA